jgi:hypothetical protein
MGVSRYRGSSRSFLRETGSVRRNASRVCGRVAVSAFAASAAAVRAARCERSHRRYSERSGGGVEADAWASRREIGGTACSAPCGLTATGPGIGVRTAAAAP